MKIIKPSTYEITPGDTILDRSFLSPFLSDEKELSGQVYHSLDPIGNWPAGTLAIALDTLNEEKDLLNFHNCFVRGFSPPNTVASRLTIFVIGGKSIAITIDLSTISRGLVLAACLGGKDSVSFAENGRNFVTLRTYVPRLKNEG